MRDRGNGRMLWIRVRMCQSEAREETGQQANLALPEGRKREQTQEPYPNSTA